MKKFFLLLLLCSAALFAHPMGNFSVSHFSKLEPTAQGVELEYVLDLAEIPTFELLRTWNLDRSAPPAALHSKAVQQARSWLDHLEITAGGRPAKARLQTVKATIADGAGNLPILRVDMTAHLDTQSGTLEYEDRNYSERAGWKEIVIAPGNNVSLLKASQSGKDLSSALTQYPADPTVAPPQELRARLEWKTTALPLTPNPTTLPEQPVVIAPVIQPHSAPPAPAPATLTKQGAPAGSLTRGDFLSRLLHQRELSFSMIFIALIAAFGLGAAHALTPGHGKTIVAAYLVGSRGTLKHAAFLGAMVTFTHTISVFALGLATLFLFRFIVPEQITAILGAISGASIVVIGAYMLYKRARNARHVYLHAHGMPHNHSHDHPHEHAHQHTHEHAHQHTHDHPHTHTHSHGIGTHTHSHMPDELSWAGLIALGASGGLVPCESALLLLLGAIALGRVGLGLLLLVSFSVGLAMVLMAIGILVLYAKNLLPERSRSQTSPLFRWVGLASPAVVIVVGTLMTATSLGWLQLK